VQVADPNYKAPRVGTRGSAVDYSVPDRFGYRGPQRMENVGSQKLLNNPKGLDAYALVGSPRTATTTDPNAGKVWALKGPDGKLYYQGQGFNYDETYDTGEKSGGFGDDFYGGISKSVTDLGNVDITDQYNKARENLQYALARQGISASSAANQGVTDVEAAKTKAQGDLALQANDAASQVRSAVDQERAAAISQLYATEDPTLAANTAMSKAQNITADKPGYSGLGDIFGSVIQGFGNIYNATRGANAGYGYQKQPSALSASGH
jgi:hypothetical protein